MEQTVWILGHGPVTIHKQFCLDIPRSRNRFRLNGRVLPPNVYEAIRMLYETCHIQYFQYSKFMNQTLGNLMVFHLQKLYWDNIVVPSHSTYRIDAIYTSFVKHIKATMEVKLYTEDLVHVATVRCFSVYDIIRDYTQIKVKLIT